MTVITYLATPIDARYLRSLLIGLIGLDATVTVNEDGVLVIEVPDVPMIRTSGQTTTATAAFAAFKEWESPEDEAYEHLDPCDCDECRPIVMHNYDSEPSVGAVVRCTGCGNVYIHKPHGWWNTDDGSTSPSLDGIKRRSCGPLFVIYTPEEGK